MLGTFLTIGTIVTTQPLLPLDRAGQAIAGEVTPLAVVFTESCYIQYLLVFMIGAIVLAVRSRAWRARMIFAIVTGLVSWRVSDFFKGHFARPRPEYWVAKHETSFAYGSGHAMFTVLVYWLFAYYLATSRVPRAARVAGTLLLVLWGFGVLWSRLALGAHYVTDLAGGIALAIAMLALGTLAARAVAPRARVL